MGNRSSLSKVYNIPALLSISELKKIYETLSIDKRTMFSSMQTVSTNFSMTDGAIYYFDKYSLSKCSLGLDEIVCVNLLNVDRTCIQLKPADYYQLVC